MERAATIVSGKLPFWDPEVCTREISPGRLSGRSPVLSSDDGLNIFTALGMSEVFRGVPDGAETRGTGFAVTESVEIRNLDNDSLVSAVDDARGAGDARSVLPEIDLLLRSFWDLDKASNCSYTRDPKSVPIPRSKFASRPQQDSPFMLLNVPYIAWSSQRATKRS